MFTLVTVITWFDCWCYFFAIAPVNTYLGFKLYYFPTLYGPIVKILATFDIKKNISLKLYPL